MSKFTQVTTLEAIALAFIAAIIPGIFLVGTMLQISVALAIYCLVAIAYLYMREYARGFIKAWRDRP